MLTDAHCHPYDLSKVFPESKQERSRLNVLAAASACTLEEFLYNETLPNVLPCFGIHPQYPQMISHGLRTEGSAEDTEGTESTEKTKKDYLLNTLEKLALEKRISAIGECGFDLYTDEYKETEAIQDELFAAHVETALKYNLPLVLHVRRAMHKIFAYSKDLAKCKAVVFHTWSGTLDEAHSFLRHGVNAYFSFGNVIMLNHKKAVKCAGLLPVETLLTETDAPYAPRRGERFSKWSDLPIILETAAALRTEAGNKITSQELETQIEANFKKVFSKNFSPTSNQRFGKERQERQD